MKQIQIAVEDILPKTFEEDFSKKAPSEEIALIRFQYYLMRRNSKQSGGLFNFRIEKLQKLKDTLNLANSYGARQHSTIEHYEKPQSR
jgi:hypothetical protein